MPKPLPPLEVLREYFCFSLDGVITLRKKTHAKDHREPGDVVGTRHSEGYLQVQFMDELYLAHRLVFYERHGWCPPILDHRDTNRSNNHPSNLRPATKSQNRANGRKSRLAAPTSSALRGVRWHKGANKWMSAIQVNKQQIYLGLFDTEQGAYEAYCAASKQYHGEFFTP